MTVILAMFAGALILGIGVIIGAAVTEAKHSRE